MAREAVGALETRDGLAHPPAFLEATESRREALAARHCVSDECAHEAADDRA